MEKFCASAYSRLIKDIPLLKIKLYFPLLNTAVVKAVYYLYNHKYFLHVNCFVLVLRPHLTLLRFTDGEDESTIWDAGD